MAKIPVPEVIEAWYFFVIFKIIFKVLLLFFAGLLVNCNIKAVSIAGVLARVAIIIESIHDFVIIIVEGF